MTIWRNTGDNLGLRQKKVISAFFVIYHFKRRERTDVLSWFLGLKLRFFEHLRGGLVFVLSMFYATGLDLAFTHTIIPCGKTSVVVTTTTQRKFEVENFGEN